MQIFKFIVEQKRLLTFQYVESFLINIKDLGDQ